MAYFKNFTKTVINFLFTIILYKFLGFLSVFIYGIIMVMIMLMFHIATTLMPSMKVDHYKERMLITISIYGVSYIAAIALVTVINLL